MAIYGSEQQLYNCFQTLFQRIDEVDADAAAALVASGLTIRFRCTQPSAEIMIDGKKQPLQIRYGATNTKPDLDIALTADTLHEILLGELRLSKALGSGRMKPRGPVWKATSLEPLLHHAQAIYPQVLQECR